MTYFSKKNAQIFGLAAITTGANLVASEYFNSVLSKKFSIPAMILLNAILSFGVCSLLRKKSASITDEDIAYTTLGLSVIQSAIILALKHQLKPKILSNFNYNIIASGILLSSNLILFYAANPNEPSRGS